MAETKKSKLGSGTLLATKHSSRVGRLTDDPDIRNFIREFMEERERRKDQGLASATVNACAEHLSKFLEREVSRHDVENAYRRIQNQEATR